MIYYDRMEGILDNKNKVIMLWTPRAACSVSMKMMFEHMGIENYKKYDWVHDYRIREFYRKYGRPTPSTLQKYFVFQVVVNPYQRAVSSFHHCCSTRLERDCNDLTFYQYLVNILHNRLRSVSARYHSKPQVRESERKYVDFYFKIEKGQEELDRRVNGPLGLRLKIGDKTSSHHADRADYQEFLGYRPFKDIQRLPRSYRCFYDEKIRRLVEEIYRYDIKVLGYTFEELP